MEEIAMLRFRLFGALTEKLGKLTKTLIEESEGTETIKTRKPVTPNNITRHYTYKAKRDLIATLSDKRGTTAVVNRSYAYNALGIPTNRTIQRQGTTRQDVFTHNDRSELTAATMGDKAFAYDYDKAPDGCKGDWTNPKGLPRRGEPPMGWRRVNIGNRKTAQEEADDFTYTANALNQYTQITENDTPFVPEFDADGNQTRIKTTTGIWTAIYNALNRPVTYTRENADGTLTVITADYDYMGRRVYKKVETVTPADPDTENSEETRTTITNHRFLYRGYLQIAALNLSRSTLNDLWLITWDPTETIATRPLAIQQSGTWYIYGTDLPKNVTEVYGTNGGIKTAYTYTPYGLVTSSGNTTQPLQWSSEYADTDLGLIYYNYRHYNPLDGRWTGRDPKGEESGFNLFAYVKDASLSDYDILGLGTKVVYSPLSVACSCGEAISLTLSANVGMSIGLKNIKGVSLLGTISLTIPCDLSRTPHVKQGFQRGRKELRLKVTVTWEEHTITNTGMSPTGNMVSWESSYTDNYKIVAEPDIVTDTSANCCSN